MNVGNVLILFFIILGLIVISLTIIIVVILKVPKEKYIFSYRVLINAILRADSMIDNANLNTIKTVEMYIAQIHKRFIQWNVEFTHEEYQLISDRISELKCKMLKKYDNLRMDDNITTKK